MTWVRSSKCASGNSCAEVKVQPDAVLIRNSFEPTVIVGLTHGEWAALVAGIKAGEFDPPTA